MNSTILLDVQHLTHVFPLTKKIAVKAVDDLSFQIYQGEIFGLVGESGSGKSTVARCVMNIYSPTKGAIYYKGINTCDPSEFRANKKMLQVTRQLLPGSPLLFRDCNRSALQPHYYKYFSAADHMRSSAILMPTMW